MRRQSPLNHLFYEGESQQDTGKDLFALLFLVMLMIAQIFMIVAYDAVENKGNKVLDANGESDDGVSFPEKTPEVGQIVQKGNKILIRFNNHLFDPRRDGAKLIVAGYTNTSKDELGKEVQTLYINYEGMIDSKTLSRSLAPLRSIGIIPVFP